MNSANIFLAIVILSASCSTRHQQNNSDQQTNTESINLRGNDYWMYWLNEQPDSLMNLYADKAIKISEQGEVLVDKASIVSTIKSLRKIHKIHTIRTLQADQQNQFLYEIGQFETDQEIHKHLIIWTQTKASKKRLLELIAKSENATGDLAAIELRRKEWIRLCNLHEVDSLVAGLYMPDAIYYNHRPPIIGTADIVATYAYMKRTNYQLTLTPIIVEPVNPSLVFEIGQCSGSYNGKYIIVWKKTTTGWQILLDSNV